MSQTVQSTKWFGRKQIWITFFAGIMYLLSACVAAGNTNTVLPWFSAVHGWDYSQMILFTSYGGYLSVVFGVICGQFVMKIGAKKMIIIGLLGGGITTIFFGMTSSFPVFLICILLNYVFTAAYQSSTINVLITTWFPRKKGLIFGWSTMGLVIANIFWAPYLTKAFDAIGQKTTMLIVAVCFFLFAVLGMVFVKNTPEEAGTYPDGDPDSALSSKEEMEAFAAYKSEWTFGKLLKTRQTWQLIFGWGLPWLAMISFVSQLVPRLMSIGYDANLASFVLMISSVIGLVGSWLFGVIDVHIGPKKTSLLLAAVILIMLITGLLQRQSIAWVWVGAVAGGAATGAVANEVPSMMGTWFGRWDISAANRLLYPVVNLLPSAGMSLVGIFLARGLGYDMLYIVDIVLSAVGLLVILSVKETLIGRK